VRGVDDHRASGSDSFGGSVVCCSMALHVCGDAASAYKHAQFPPLLIPPALNTPQRQEFQMGRTAHTRGRFADSTRAVHSSMGVF
jgi:hypothetical protein